MLFLLSLLACSSVPNGNACLKFAELQCETCSLDAIGDTWCTCIENGTLNQDDFPKGYDYTNTEAEVACASYLYAQQYPGPSDAAYCKQSLEYMEEWEDDACPPTRDEDDSSED